MTVEESLRFSYDGWYASSIDEALDDDFERLILAIVVWYQNRLDSSEYAHDAEPVVCVGFDTRVDSKRFAQRASSVLAEFGIRVLIASCACPRPVFSRAVCKDESAWGGLYFGAGDRSWWCVGLTLCRADGGVLLEDDFQTIGGYMGVDPHIRPAATVHEVDFCEPYREEMLPKFDATCMESSGIRVVFDAMYGPAADLTHALMRDSGLDVVPIRRGRLPEGDSFCLGAREPWIDACEQEVGACAADLGICVDGAGMRFAVIDEKGRSLSPRVTISLILGHLVECRGLHGRVVTSLAGSSIVRRQATRLGCLTVTTLPGYSWAQDEIDAGDVMLASDSFGGVAIPSLSTGRDALVAAMLFCELMAKTRMRVTELVADLASKVGLMSYARRDVRVEPSTLMALRAILPGYNPDMVCGRSPVHVNHVDGFRVQFDDDSWLLVRLSRFAPVVRVVAEADTPELCDELLDAGVDLVHNGAAS